MLQTSGTTHEHILRRAHAE